MGGSKEQKNKEQWIKGRKGSMNLGDKRNNGTKETMDQRNKRTMERKNNRSKG